METSGLRRRTDRAVELGLAQLRAAMEATGLALVHSRASNLLHATARCTRIAAAAIVAAAPPPPPPRRSPGRRPAPGPPPARPSHPLARPRPSQVAGYKVKCMLAEPKTRRGAGEAAYLQGLAARGTQVLPQVRAGQPSGGPSGRRHLLAGQRASGSGCAPAAGGTGGGVAQRRSGGPACVWQLCADRPVPPLPRCRAACRGCWRAWACPRPTLPPPPTRHYCRRSTLGS